MKIYYRHTHIKMQMLPTFYISQLAAASTKYHFNVRGEHIFFCGVNACYQRKKDIYFKLKSLFTEYIIMVLCS